MIDVKMKYALWLLVAYISAVSVYGVYVVAKPAMAPSTDGKDTTVVASRPAMHGRQGPTGNISDSKPEEARAMTKGGGFVGETKAESDISGFFGSP